MDADHHEECFELSLSLSSHSGFAFIWWISSNSFDVCVILRGIYKTRSPMAWITLITQTTKLSSNYNNFSSCVCICKSHTQWLRHIKRETRIEWKWYFTNAFLFHFISGIYFAVCFFLLFGYFFLFFCLSLSSEKWEDMIKYLVRKFFVSKFC
jgi:hypothetical protein